MELITSHHALAMNMGVSNNLFGGVMLSWLDLAGAGYASELCDSPKLVTKTFDKTIFELPVKIGNIIKIYGEVVKFGTTSITVKLEARKQNVERHEQKVVCSTTVVYVKINDEGEPIRISDRVKERYYKRLEENGKGLMPYEIVD